MPKHEMLSRVTHSGFGCENRPTCHIQMLAEWSSRVAESFIKFSVAHAALFTDERAVERRIKAEPGRPDIAIDLFRIWHHTGDDITKMVQSDETSHECRICEFRPTDDYAWHRSAASDRANRLGASHVRSHSYPMGARRIYRGKHCEDCVDP